MSISRVTALRASAEAVALAKDTQHNVDRNRLCQPTSAEAEVEVIQTCCLK
jgi:hypothetical protein